MAEKDGEPGLAIIFGTKSKGGQKPPGDSGDSDWEEAAVEFDPTLKGDPVRMKALRELIRLA